MYIKEHLKSNPNARNNMVETCMSETTATNGRNLDAPAADVTRALPPTKTEKRTMRILILLGVASVINFLWWFLDRQHVGNKTLYVLLTFALFYKLLRILHEWYHYWDISVPRRPVAKRTYTVDMLTTACPGEPYEMFRRTLTAMQAVRYPHTSYLCDEGNDPALKALCEELGVIHVTRRVKKGRQGRQHQQRPAASHGRAVRGDGPRPRTRPRVPRPGSTLLREPRNRLRADGAGLLQHAREPGGQGRGPADLQLSTAP
jgi:hypothetical protein